MNRDPIEYLGSPYNLYEYVAANPLLYIDPFGLALDSVTAAFEACGKLPSAAARLKCYRDLLGLDPNLDKKLKPAIDKVKRLLESAKDIIRKECKGSVNREFPREFRDKTLEEIQKLGRRKPQKGQDELNDLIEKARKAWKLLNDKRFKKGAK